MSTMQQARQKKDQNNTATVGVSLAIQKKVYYKLTQQSYTGKDVFWAYTDKDFVKYKAESGATETEVICKMGEGGFATKKGVENWEKF